MQRRHPAERQLPRLIDELLASSPAFAEMWEQRPAPQGSPVSRTFLHPEIGPITLDSDILTVRDGDLRLIVYTAPPGSQSAGQLELLATIGIQQFS
ncbi:hypothetical protein [Kineosporia mesophila]|uniref:MmyB family transcriptional regulator n=1 Tax=Kineosporia mesophila TaxID=566012 RepID=UPI0031EE7B2D